MAALTRSLSDKFYQTHLGFSCRGLLPLWLSRKYARVRSAAIRSNGEIVHRSLEVHSRCSYKL